MKAYNLFITYNISGGGGLILRGACLGDKHIGRRVGMKLAWIVCVGVRRSFYKEYSGR